MAVEIFEDIDEFGNPKIIIKDLEKNRASYYVTKTVDGFALYEVGVDRGKLPPSLSSTYTSIDFAQKAILHYLSSRAKTSGVKREENRKAMEMSRNGG